MLQMKGTFDKIEGLGKAYTSAKRLHSSATALLTVTMEVATVTAENQYTDSVSDSQPTSDSSIPDWYTLEPHQFIETLFGEIPAGWVEVYYAAPETAAIYPRKYVQWAELPLTNLDPELPNIMQMNAKGYNCYVAPAVRGRKYEPEQRTNDKGRSYTSYPRGKAYDAIWISALWVDVDVPGDEGRLQIINHLIPPSILISTGGGWHGYWLLTEPLAVTDESRPLIKQTLKGMALACNGDTKVADLARVMRIPGTINTKPDRGQRAYIYDFIPGRYHYVEMELGYAPLAAPSQPPVHRDLPITASAGMPRWVENYLNAGAAQGERNNTAYAAARALLDNGFSTADMERLITNRAASDGLSSQEITTLLHSAENAPRSTPELPMHLRQRMAMGDHRGMK